MTIINSFASLGNQSSNSAISQATINEVSQKLPILKH